MAQTVYSTNIENSFLKALGPYTVHVTGTLPSDAKNQQILVGQPGEVGQLLCLGDPLSIENEVIHFHQAPFEMLKDN